MNSHDAGGLRPSPPKPLASWYAQGLSDGLGDRLLMFDNSAAPSLELLRFRPDLALVPGFENALRDQVQRLNRFRHPAFARVRSVQRLEPDDDLALISNCTPGKRLSEVLHRARGPAFAATLIRQLAPALALLQQHDAGISHGVLSPDRIIVSPDGRLTIVEHVVGPAIDTLELQTAQLASIGIPLPPAAGSASPRLDVATDWYQLGLVAVSVLIGRPVTAGELPQLETLLDGSGLAAGSDGPGLSPFIRQWLDRALQISGTRIESGADARAALDELLHKERPRDSRRVEAVRHEQPSPSARTLTTRNDGAGSSTPDVERAGPAIARPTREVTGDDRSRPGAIAASPPPVPAPADHATLETHPQWEPRQPLPDVLSMFHPEPVTAQTRALDAGRTAAQRDARAVTRTRLLDLHAATRPHSTNAAPPRPRAVGRARISTSTVAALALIAIVEAGVIAALARALWVAPQPPVIVQTGGSGGDVLVTSRSTERAPLRLTVAPDLRWVRVTSPSAAGVLGEKVTNAPAGTVRISSPIELKVFEDSRLLGSVPGAVLKVPAGRHDLELVNVALGYRSRQAVEIEDGETVSIYVAPPPGWVTVDASPWAEVSIDGQSIGRTPLGPLPLAPGEHQVTFRNPAGGTDRQHVTLKSEANVRVIGILRR